MNFVKGFQMAIISHAQNHEDTRLWRALGRVPAGCYIDVGAYDPDLHSVTKAFYERGWRGINIEPVAAGHALLSQFRPLDLNLKVAIGLAGGASPFFHIPETGLSTLDSVVAERHRQAGWSVEVQEVPTLPLREVWDVHIRGEVHFLKVDVEGAEGVVLGSLDLARQRPWIVVVESTVPLSREESHQHWEALLLENHYVFAGFDGLNRYYAATEHAELVEALALPVSVFDESTPVAEDAAWRAAEVANRQRDWLLELAVDALGGFDPRDHPHLHAHLNGPLPSLAHPGSQLCTRSQFDDPLYARWCSLLRETPRLVRKQWEWVYILQALWDRGVMRAGARGLGFGCGQEPLAAALATFGCEVVATDLDAEDLRSQVWRDTDQHASGRVEALNDRGICPPDLFRRRVTYRNADMNLIPDDLRDFDFLWSSCSLEHIGSLRHGMDFVRRAMACLRPGGWAIHTTEFNLSSNEATLESPTLSFFRLQDLERLTSELAAEGHEVLPFNLHPGNTVCDRFVDLPPFQAWWERVHLRLRIADHTITSVGFLVRKGVGAPAPAAEAPARPEPPTEAELEPWLRAMEADPRDIAPFQEAARRFESAGDSATARRLLEAGLDQNPGSAPLWEALVDLSLARGDLQAAAKDAWDALGQVPDGGGGEWHLRVARALLAGGVRNEARLVLERGLARFPDHGGLQRLRAITPP